MRRHLVSVALLALWPSLLAGQTALVVITGLGGEVRYDERFHAWAATLMDAAQDRYGLTADDIVYLAARPERDPARSTATSSKDRVTATLDSLAQRLDSTTQLFVVVIGHGSYRNGVSKVNLPGPDMTAEEFADVLDGFGPRPIMFANLTSASGGFIAALSGPNRTIITATKSGMERNESVFAQYFIAAFVGDVADLDQDRNLSVLEAFTYARTEVERAYERDQKLLTEHAVLDDNGDGEGSATPGGEDPDGAFAATMLLSGTSGGVAAATSDDPELRRLGVEKQRLERAIATLRASKGELSIEEYEARLEELLVQLALTNRAIRERQDGT